MAKRDNRATIAIIGGGLSGTLVAAHLLARKLMSDARRRPLRVVLIERAADQLGRGVAYGTSDRVHLLNVPACNMSAFADEPDHFLRWCDRRGISITRDTFVPRMIYGEYLPDVLQEAGYIAPDELSVGVEVTASGALVNHRGEESATLFTLGPWRRPLLWETTAAPEIRAQAAVLADHLAASLGATPAPTMMPFPEAQNVLREQSVYDWVI